MNRRSLLGSIATALFGSKLQVAARTNNLAASLIPIKVKQEIIKDYSYLRPRTIASYGVIGNQTTSEVFLKNNLQPIINSLDGSIISAKRTEYNEFGVSIFVDPSGIFTNEWGIEGA